jgi:hypothetical protein
LAATVAPPAAPALRRVRVRVRVRVRARAQMMLLLPLPLLRLLAYLALLSLPARDPLRQVTAVRRPSLASPRSECAPQDRPRGIRR